ncbi:hypothetical protein PTR36_20585 [Serratia bockelmannii]|uniref:hypothetical protein n=1 Tax=Serratia TaxID=613 RepID=UPI0027E4193A|nr:hypothetical protein [Serratia marcescens]
MGRNNGIEEGIHTGSGFLDLKSSLYFFVWIVNPVGQPGQKAEMAGVRHRVCGENKHYWAFSGTIFYLFALSKVSLWAYLMRRRIINKIMLASFTYTVWASLSFPIRNGAGLPGVYFLPASSIGLTDKSHGNFDAGKPPTRPRRPYETRLPIR